VLPLLVLWKKESRSSITRADGELLSMAGLFNYLETSSIQRQADADFCGCHDHAKSMDGKNSQSNGVILQDNQIDTWLDPRLSDPSELEQLLNAPPEGFLDCYPVSRKINSAQADEPEERIELDYEALLLQNQNTPQILN